MNKDNIVEILKAYNIPYALTGKNVSKGYIGLNCPFCDDDDNFHLGINPEKNFFACWRNNEHRGNIVKLFMKTEIFDSLLHFLLQEESVEKFLVVSSS